MTEINKKPELAKEKDDTKERVDQIYPGLRSWLKSQFGESAELIADKQEISMVRVRQGVQLNKSPGDRVRLTFEVKLNLGRSAGCFDEESARGNEIQKDDVIQVNHNGPEDLIGAFLQVSEAHVWGVRAFSIVAKRYVRLDTTQYDRVGPAPLVTAMNPEQLDTEPMDHHLKEGEVVHSTQLKERGKIEQTSPMPHAIRANLPEPKSAPVVPPESQSKKP